jgi:hypothetical protein
MNVFWFSKMYRQPSRSGLILRQNPLRGVGVVVADGRGLCTYYWPKHYGVQWVPVCSILLTLLLLAVKWQAVKKQSPKNLSFCLFCIGSARDLLSLSQCDR